MSNKTVKSEMEYIFVWFFKYLKQLKTKYLLLTLKFCKESFKATFHTGYVVMFLDDDLLNN